jgi:hypothetical protein
MDVAVAKLPDAVDQALGISALEFHPVAVCAVPEIELVSFLR